MAAAVALLTAGCGDPLDRLAQGERGRVETVFSGGRLRLEDGTELRLAGVEAPGQGEAGAEAARAALTRLARGREVVLLYGGPRRDGFGRAVAQVRVLRGRVWVQGRLLDEGLARVRTTASDRALADEMLAREAGARTAGRGLWSGADWRVLLPEEIREPGFVLVEGRLGAVVRNRRGASAALGRSDMRLTVSRTALAEMSAAGTPLEDLVGGTLRVRGRVGRGLGGWILAVDHPEQIERLRAE